MNKDDLNQKQGNQVSPDKPNKTVVVVAGIFGSCLLIALLVLLLRKKQTTPDNNSVGSQSGIGHLAINAIAWNGSHLNWTGDDPPVTADTWLTQGLGAWGRLISKLEAIALNNEGKEPDEWLTFHQWSASISKLKRNHPNKVERGFWAPAQLITETVELSDGTYNSVMYASLRDKDHVYNRPISKMAPFIWTLVGLRVFYFPEYVWHNRSEYRRYKGNKLGECYYVADWELRTADNRVPWPDDVTTLSRNQGLLTVSFCGMLDVAAKRYKWANNQRYINNEVLRKVADDCVNRSGFVTYDVATMASRFAISSADKHLINGRPYATSHDRNAYESMQGAWESALFGKPIWAILDPIYGSPLTSSLTGPGRLFNNLGQVQDSSADSDSGDDESDDDPQNPTPSRINSDDLNRINSNFTVLLSPGAWCYYAPTLKTTTILVQGVWNQYLLKGYSALSQANDNYAHVALRINQGVYTRPGYGTNSANCVFNSLSKAGMHIETSVSTQSWGNIHIDEEPLPWPVLVNSRYSSVYANIMRERGDVNYLNDHYLILNPAYGVTLTEAGAIDQTLPQV